MMTANNKTKIGPKQSPRIKNANNELHVALLYGGMSAEREVSIMSFNGFNNALLDLGYYVTPVDVGQDFIVAIQNVGHDVVFNGLYGQYGEDGYIPAILDMLNMKYTHSGVVASAIGFNKISSYKIFASQGIKYPRYFVISKNDQLKTDPMKRPYVIKPISEGSSVGVELIFDEDVFNFADYEWKYGNQIIVQEYVPGMELQVAVFNDKAVGIIELVPLKNRFYDYQSKYTDGFTKHVMPATLDKQTEQRILEAAELAHKAIGCKTVSRVDFLYNPKEALDGIYILEINTHPGMTPLSLVPEICAYYGIPYHDIVDRLVKDAVS